MIVVDEAHLFSYGALPQLLAQARKFRIGVVLATQHLGQLTGELADAVESNTGTFVALRSGLQSAGRASTRLGGWPVTDLVRQPALTGAAALSRSGVVSTPFLLHLDQHARVRRLQRAGTVGERVAASVETRSAALAAPHRSLRPVSDRELAVLLAPTDGSSAPARSPGPVAPTPSALDEWLTKRPSS